MKRNTRFAILSVAMGIAAPLVALEIGLRAFNLGYGYSGEESDPVFHHVHAKNYSFLSYSPEGEWDGGRVYYDANGFVAPANRYSDQTATCRIAFLGDSFTEARQVPYALSFVGRLAHASRCAVRNYGVGSYSPVLYLLQWEQIVRNTKPDLMILQLYSNDISDDAAYAKVAEYDGRGKITAVPGPDADLFEWTSLARRGTRQSYLLRLVRRATLTIAWWIENRSEPAYTVGGYVEEFPGISPLSSDTMKDLSRRIAAEGSTLVLFVVPSKFHLTHLGEAVADTSEFSDKWKGWAADNDVEFVDVVEPFRLAAEKGHLPFFERDIHFNAVGHDIVAQTLCKKFPQYFDATGCGRELRTQ